MHLTPVRATKRGCGRRPSRSAWQMLNTSEPVDALRLVLRTQPRSDWPTCLKYIALNLKSAANQWLAPVENVGVSVSRPLEPAAVLAGGCLQASRAWWNGRHARLRIWFRKDWGFK